MKTHISSFKAALPKFSALLLPDSHAQVVSDCSLGSGDTIRIVGGGTFQANPGPAAPPYVSYTPFDISGTIP